MIQFEYVERGDDTIVIGRLDGKVFQTIAFIEEGLKRIEQAEKLLTKVLRVAG